MKFNIAVIIPTHNRLRYLRRLLHDLKEQVLDSNISVIPVVVIDGSNDGTLEYCVENDIAHIIGDGNWWYTKCINAGVSFAEDKIRPSHLLLTNDDVRFQSNFIACLVRDYKDINNDKSILTSIFVDDITGSVLYRGTRNFNRTFLKSSLRLAFDKSTSTGIEGVHRNYDLSGRCIFTRYSTWQTSGPYDEAFPQYGSDTEYGIRALLHGYELFISKNCALLESVADTCNYHVSKKITLGAYFRSLFYKYSSNFVGNRFRIIVKHSRTAWIPFNIILSCISIVFVYAKYFSR